MRTIGRDFGDTARKVYAVASGALPDGKPVIVNSDGTVSVVANSAVSEATGSSVVYRDAITSYIGSVYDTSTDRLVIAYRDEGDSDKGKAIVGTISGTSVSFGTAVEFEQGGTSRLDITFDSNANKIVIAFRDAADSNKGKAIVGTVSGTSISFGTATVFNSATTDNTSCTFDSNSNKVVICYKDEGNSNYGTAIVGTVSGTSISFGSEVVFNAASPGPNDITFDSTNNKVVIAYKDGNNSSYGTAIVGTVSGTSISFGTEAVFESAEVSRVGTAYDSSNQKIVIAYRDHGNGDRGTAIVGTVSGTDITFGTAAVFNDGASATVTVAYSSVANKMAISYVDSDDSSKGKLNIATISGTNISFGSDVIYENNVTADNFITDITGEGKFALAFRDGRSGVDESEAIIYQPAYTSTNLTTENFLGFTGGEVTFVNQVVGSGTVFESAATSYTSTTFDSNSNRVVVAYRDGGNSNRGTAVVGTVSGTSVSFGTPVVFNSGETVYVSATFDSNSNKVVVAYRDQGNSSYGTAVVGTVDSSNNSISFGSETVFETAQTNYISTTFDSNLNKVVISYIDAGDSDKGKSIVGTVSGTSISFGTAVQFEAGETSLIFSSFDNNSNKVVTSFKDKSDSNIGKSIVGTVSGTSISFGTAVAFNTAAPDEIRSSFDTFSNKTVVAYKRTGGDGSYLSSIVGTVSGTSISFGAESVVREGGTAAPSVAYDASANRSVVFYKDSSNSNYGTFRVGTISGTSITYDTAVVFLSGNIEDLSSTYEANSEKVVVSGNNQSNSQYGTSVVLQTGATTRGEIADGKTATIQVGGSINTQQNALTAGQQYFVQTDGTIGTTAASPSVLAGTAVSATDLIVKG